MITAIRGSALREALAKLGWIEGRNLKVEGRFGVTDANRLRAAAVELVSLAPDVIVAGGLCRRARCNKQRRPSRLSLPGAATRPPSERPSAIADDSLDFVDVDAPALRRERSRRDLELVYS